jgi:hypothetical protein
MQGDDGDAGPVGKRILSALQNPVQWWCKMRCSKRPHILERIGKIRRKE